MATLLLQAAGQALGGTLGGALGGVIGRAAGGLAGYAIDQALISRLTPARQVQGPRLKELDVQASSEGAPVPRLYGRARLAGQIVWATRFEEEVNTSTQSSGGKFGGGARTRTTTYSYFANFAIALCEGPITRIGRIWADGKPLDVSAIEYRVYTGTEDQSADPLIEAKEGAGNAPAYRGLAYIVFERLALETFGNRLPQLSFEVFRAIDGLENRIEAMTVIPATTEFGYDTVPVTRSAGAGQTAPENQHTGTGATDWTVAIDDLTATCPNVGSVALVVSWFGDDLRCGDCAIRPGVDQAEKETQGRTWQVNGIARGAAHTVSQIAGRPAYGGTPSDASLLAAIADLKARGLKVDFYPFILMDIPDGNGLPDPHGGGEQPAHPWRGRVTCHPAPGEEGTVDRMAAAGAQVASLFGTAAAGDFTPQEETVSYSGPAEWSLRRMILHYAHLCAQAGGVDAFLIGSEMQALTQVRDGAASYPAVDALVALAADARGILGPDTTISYAANWGEYSGHRPDDGSGDVFFHLDPLWASADIDVIAIDNYMPLADWRDGDSHLDAQAGHTSIHDLAYLRGNIAGGEGFDWYYASSADREAQTRTPITDANQGKPFVWRVKDIKGWWQNQHFNRPGGVEAAEPTAWVPEGKPVWFTEAGCPAVDKGANQPSAFIDPKSVESGLPYFSSGARDDLMQRRYIEALTSYWSPDHSDFDDANNPVSAVYGGRMVEAGRIHFWTWDARPFPQFPYLASVWADGPNWETGHWLTGRVGSVSLDRLTAEILTGYGFDAFETAGLRGVADGYVIDRPMSARDALEPLSLAFFFDGVESAGSLRFAHREDTVAIETDPGDLVPQETGAPYALTRAQETELPVAAGLSYIDAVADYRVASVESRRLVGLSRRESRADLPLVTGQARMQATADIWLQDVWAARETAAFTLPPSALRLEPGDAVSLAGDERRFLIGEIADGPARRATARAIVRSLYAPAAAPARGRTLEALPVFGVPYVLFLDIPAVAPGDDPAQGAIAAFAAPWPGAVALYRSRDGESFELVQRIEGAAVTGALAAPLAPGRTAHWDMANVIDVVLHGGALAARSDGDVLAGANMAVVQNDAGAWELIQFADAELVAEKTYRLTRLLRGQRGTEDAMAADVSAGAPFVLLDGLAERIAMTADDLDIPLIWRFGPAGRDIADAAFGEASVTLAGRGLRPFSPVHPRAARNGADMALSWVRRTRAGGDAWDQIDVPLGETEEAYEVDIRDGETVLRTLSSAMPAVTYTEAMQVADFGAPVTQIDIDIAQLSPVRGRGTARRATLNV